MARLLRSRLILAATVVAAVVLSAAVLTAAGATTRPDLPPIAPDRLVASSLGAIADRSLSMSGTFQTHVDLGIPQLPGLPADASGPLGLLLSDQTFKVWRSSDGVRLAQILPAAERDLVVTPTQAWLWDSTRFTAWHAVPSAAPQLPSEPTMADLDTLVSNLMTRLSPYAALSEAPQTEVAGRAAYVLSLTPVSTSTLVDRVEVAIDGETRIPLRLEIFARGTTAPVVRIGYTDVSFGGVDPSVFAFRPPAGATVHEVRPPADDAAGAGASDGPQVRWFGTGFDLVAAVEIPAVPKDYSVLFPYRGPIASADLVDRGDHTWIVAGLVPPSTLAKVEPALR
jgi:hypothetical protein